jgi:hypothetical protein
MKKKQKGPGYSEKERGEMLEFTELSYELGSGLERKRLKKKNK